MVWYDFCPNVIPDHIDYIVITTDGHHYGSILEAVSEKMHIRIKRQMCLFHIEKDLAHRIKDSHKENELTTAKRVIKYVYFRSFSLRYEKVSTT
jgi:hypothetical protein